MKLSHIFNGDNFIFRYSNYILDVVMLSILWLFLSLPLVTAGGATAALYYTVSCRTRRGQVLPYADFWRSFRENFKLGIPSGLLAAAALWLLWVGLTLMRALAAYDSRYMIVYSMYYFACIVPLGIMCYAFPLLGRFQVSLGGLITTAFQLTLRHLPTTVLLVVLVVLAGAVCTSLYWTFLFVPALTVLVMSFFLERIFGKYLPAPPEETEPGESESAD